MVRHSTAATRVVFYRFPGVVCASAALDDPCLPELNGLTVKEMG